MQKAIDLVGQTAIAKAFDPPVTTQAVNKWKKTLVPADRCPTIERLTNGQVTCEELRPDVEWSVLRSKRHKKAA